jgi:hypothetical protein
MVITGEIINQPYSGEYKERVYDNDSPWNSQGWTWIKFTNDDSFEWCGEFRGFPRDIAVSERKSYSRRDYKKANKINDEIIKLFSIFKEQKMEEDLHKFLLHENSSVKVYTASFLLESKFKSDALNTLKKIAEGKGIASVDAQAILDMKGLDKI